MFPATPKTAEPSIIQIATRAILLALAVYVLPSSATSQVKWLLPTPVQSAQEQKTQVPRTAWQLPNKPPYVRDAAGAAQISPTDRPSLPLFDIGAVVTTGFSGIFHKKPLIRRDAPLPDPDDPQFQFLNPNGAVATLIGTDRIGFAFNGVELTRVPYDKILARDVGQVFGVALDNEDFRNLYLTATSAFGLNIVGADRNRDRVPDRLLFGEDNARWMPVQWGNHPLAGPGSVWKVDGETGQITLLTNIQHDGTENAGPGLGNIAFDADHNQLFVSDLQSGLIHRLDLNGVDHGTHDHGLSDALKPNDQVAHDPEQTMDIRNAEFDSEDPETWGFADPARRVWGIAVQGGRLYYAVAQGPSVYSVGLDPVSGDFLKDTRWELTVTGTQSKSEISDIVFTGDGAMVLAQRGDRVAAFDHRRLTRARRAEVLRYVMEYPADDTTPSVWVKQPQTYPVGFSSNHANSLGGVAVGPRYDETGSWDTQYCGATLWTTGESLRDDKPLRHALEKGGELRIDGLQAQPVALNEAANQPPWQSYFVDYDSRYDGPRVTGHIGDVEVVGCRPSGGNAGDYSEYDGDVSTDCAAQPWLCAPPEPSCLEVVAQPSCNTSTGEYAVQATFADKFNNGLDTVKITDPTGQIGSIPQEQSLFANFATQLTGMTSGQVAQFDVCGFRKAEASTGAPFACCKASISITIPTQTCKKESE